ncbi:MAG TPA: alpha-glucan family phosphorylase [Candidatus Binatia bacterium]|nr:alpha-glucan family phosphorylase [Candidatus Binatia bacterium]
MTDDTSSIAYFSMEVALENAIPTYAGGLGVLAGDMLRSAADRGLPMIGVTLVHRKGYLFQRLDPEGRQREEDVAWPIHDHLEPLDARAVVEIEGRRVTVRAWRYRVTGVTGQDVPVLLLDTDLEGNDPFDRTLTDHLYGGDARYRLCQEVVLGIGGVRMLRTLGVPSPARYHMNEGHSTLLAVEVFAEELEKGGDRAEALERTKRRCVFTTHTPVPAGHDRFPIDLAWNVLGSGPVGALRAMGCCEDVLNMTLIGFQLSHYVNGVTKRHSEESRLMFPGYPVGAITNGVHAVTWTSPTFRDLFDRHLPDWRADSFLLRGALVIPRDEIRAAHQGAKAALIDRVNEETNAGFDLETITLGFARRMTAYKRPTLLLRDPAALEAVAREHGAIQIVFAGKTHPRDDEGKAMIQEILRWQAEPKPGVKIAFLPNYDLELGARITAGVDVWVNNPRPPAEASGTSGMKAAMNGVPSLSVLDGWWLEGHIEGVTGWSVGSTDMEAAARRSDEEDAGGLMVALGTKILPLYYRDPDAWTEMMRSTIAFTGSFFNTQRMLQEYVHLAYRDRAAGQPHPTLASTGG